MDDIRWADPPPSRRNTPRSGQGRRQRWAAELKTHPGQWAQYRPDEPHWPSVATYFKGLDPHIESVVRKRPDGRYDVYARWVGNGSEPS